MKINLFGTRDFGQNFDMSIAFVKQNYVAILKNICFFIPLILIGALIMPSPMEIQSRQQAITSLSDIFNVYGIDSLIAYICIGLASLASATYTISYMAEYVKSETKEVNSSAVWSNFGKVILPLFICQIVYIICVTIGTILCIIPGIFIAISCAFYSYTYIVEEETIIGSLKRSYELVKGNFWITFGFGLVIGIVVSIIGSLFSIPLMLSSIGQVLGIETFSSSMYVITTSIISYGGQLLISPISYMALGVFYFNLRNQNEGIDMKENIDNLGSQNQY
ncbi:MAG: hypothetical protein QM660_09255 [Dysgonomonas sp.]